MQNPSFAVALWLGYVSLSLERNHIWPFLGLVRTGPQSGPIWTEKWSELDRSAVQTGPRNWQNRGGPNWTAIFMFSKTEYLSRARAKEPVQTTKSGPNWLEPEELGSRRGGCASSRLDHGLKV